MYTPELVVLANSSANKSTMIKLSLNKESRILIENATSWMETFYKNIPLKIRCVAILSGYTANSFPKCKNCDSPVGYDKEYQASFNLFCSNKCAKSYGRLPEHTKECLSSYDWLYNKRIVERLSYHSIGELLKCSEVPVKKACSELNIPIVKLNESIASVTRTLNNKEFLISEHKLKHKKLSSIASEINTSKSTLSLYLIKHGIEANNANSYDRTPSTMSKECEEVYAYICELLPSTYIKINDRTILNGKEIDILIPSLKIGFEYNGIYSHIHSHKIGEINKEKSYHLDKTLNAKENGVKLVHIFSDDWILNKDVVKALISAKLGLNSTSIFARKCEVVKITNPEKISFLNMNHLQGKDKSSIQYGLKYNNEIVAVMTFCKSRYNREFDWELSRFAVKRYTKVIGGFSKLLTAFRREYIGSIISYADRSHSEGDVYIKNGFKLIKTNKPAYKYVNLTKSIKRLHRANFMKKKIAPNDDRAGWEVMFSLGYKQIYDCGTLTFVLI